MRISDWSSDVCSSDLNTKHLGRPLFGGTTGTDQAFDPNGTYIGDDGAIERTVMDGLTVQVNVTGEQVFGTNGSNVFDVLTDIVDSLRNDPSALHANLAALDERAVAFRSAHTSAERRVGNECGSTFRYWWSPSHYKKKRTKNK